MDYIFHTIRSQISANRTFGSNGRISWAKQTSIRMTRSPGMTRLTGQELIKAAISGKKEDAGHMRIMFIEQDII